MSLHRSCSLAMPSSARKVGATEFPVIQTVTNVDFDKCLAAGNQTSALVAAFPLPRGLPMIVPPFTQAGNITEVVRRVSVPLEGFVDDAALVAMTSNFPFNNLLTYRNRQPRGWEGLRGSLSFAAASTLGV